MNFYATYIIKHIEKRWGGTENIFEDIIVENFPNLGKETDIQVQEEWLDTF